MTPPTPYDTVAYPSSIFEQTHPARLRMIARMHGVTAPPVETARILEIGGGDGLNVLALAVAYPHAHFVSFDLAETAVARGQELLAESGLKNVEITVGDIMTAQSHYAAGSFDYIIAHGVYAWVPEPVRVATMALIAHALAPDGVAYLSYNALPGGYIRMAMRDMLLHALEGATDDADRIGKTDRYLRLFAEPQEHDDPVVKAMRAQASSMLDRPDSVLFHDELGDVFAPQRLTDVVHAAQGVGLRFLSDEPGQKRAFDGFLPDGVDPDDDVEVQIIRAAQAHDYAGVRFFRQTLFVHDSVMPARQIDLSRLDGLWMSCTLARTETGGFACGEARFTIGDEELARMIDIVTENFPDRFAFAEKVDDPMRRRALLDLFARGYVYFHEGPPPFPLQAGDRPEVSPLVRAQLRLRHEFVCTLTHRMVAIRQAELSSLLQAADGSRTIDEIAALPDLNFPSDQILPALNASAQRGLLVC